MNGKCNRIALLALAFVTFPAVCSAGETRLAAGMAFVDSGMRDDPAQRKLVIDDATETSTQIRWDVAYPQADVLRDTQASALELGAHNTSDFHVNPEPSSIEVWSAMAISVLAAGYAYRRRLEFQSQMSTAIA